MIRMSNIEGTSPSLKYVESFIGSGVIISHPGSLNQFSNVGNTLDHVSPLSDEPEKVNTQGQRPVYP